MKKNLRNILVLGLGLMTTITFAQDWDVDSRTRIDMSGEDGKMLTEQRATLGATWGGSDWGIHVSTDVNYDLGAADANGQQVPAALGVYEAYASTSLMGYANLTVGRQALDYGSGAIMSSNQFGARTTWDGMKFDLGLDMADITFGYASRNAGTPDDANGVSMENKGSNIYMNVGKADGDWSANLLYAKSTRTMLGTDQEGTNNGDGTAMGLDLSYALMGGALGLDVSYNTNSGDTGTDDEEDMLSIGATYNVNDQMSVTANQTTYGENGFDVAGTNMAGGFADNGNMGYLNANDMDRNVGISYSMGAFSIGATMHQITNTGDDVAPSTTNGDYSRDVMEMSLGYTMSDNASLSLQYASDTENDADAVKHMWLTLNIRP